MSLSNLAQVTDQIQKYWSPRFMAELRESQLLGALVNKDYEGEIKKGGDTVRVSQVVAPEGELLDVGVNADSFNSDQISTLKIDIVANKRAVASFKFADLVDIQSLIDKENPEVMNALKYTVGKKINDYLYTLVSPSTSAPDHDLGSTASMSASVLQSVRKLAGQAKWLQDNQWYFLMDPAYYSDIMGVAALTSTDFGASDAPVISGQIALPRFGFKILEDNSRGASGAYGLAFHPDFMHLVMQTQPTIKISDRHALGEFGYIMSVDIVFGAILGIAGNVKHIRVTA